MRYRGARSAVNVLAAQGIGYDDRLLFTDGVASDSSQQIDASLHSLGRVSLRVFLFNRSAAARSQFGEARKFWAARATSVDVLTDLRGNRVERSFALAIYRQLGVQTR